jgi:serine-type D-Ala-D-Ala carboxypeptidase/endopeptidase
MVEANSMVAPATRMICFLLLAIIAPCVASFGEESVSPQQTRTLVDRLGNKLIERPESVGLSIGITVNGQQEFFNFGKIAKDSSQPPDQDTIYEIGSVSKTMTGTLLAQAVIEGKLSLDDDLRKYLNGDYPNLEYAGEPIRIKHLLNHTSGLPYQLPFQREDFQSMSAERSRRLNQRQQQYSKQDLFDDLHEVELRAVPGKNLSYSSTSAQLLGYILEEVYGKSFDELLKSKLFSPLAMQRSGIAFGDDMKNRAKGYSASGEEMPHVARSIAAAGGISSTASDLLKYAEFHLDERDPAVALSHQPTWGQIEYYAIGLNWQMEDKHDSPRRIWQSGGTGGFSSLLIIYPESQIGIAILANESDENSQGLLSEMAKEIFDSLVAE